MSVHDTSSLAEITFAAPVIHWRGPSPFHFIVVPEELAGELRYAARTVSYGWGMVPVAARIGDTVFETALFPKNGTYYLPLKDAVRADAGLDLGDVVTTRLIVRTPQNLP